MGTARDPDDSRGMSPWPNDVYRSFLPLVYSFSLRPSDHLDLHTFYLDDMAPLYIP